MLMVIVVIAVMILLYAYNVYVYFTQVKKDPNLKEGEKLAWWLFLLKDPLFGLWMHNYTRSKRKNKNIFRY